MSQPKLQTQWDFTPLTSDKTSRSPEDFLQDKLAEEWRLVDFFVKKWQDSDQYLQQPAVLSQALHDYEQLMANYGCNSWQTYYYQLAWSKNQTDSQLRAKMSQADEEATKLANTLQFFPLSIARIEPDLQPKFLDAPELVEYRYYLQRLFARQAHTLSDAEEKVINLMADPAASAWVNMTESFLSQESATVTIDHQQTKQSLPELLSLLSSRSAEVRDQAADHINRIVAKHAPVATEEMNALMRFKKINDQMRGYSRPDAARHLSDGVDTGMVDALRQAVSSRFDLSQRFYQLKATLLGLPQLRYHERNIEYGHIVQKYSFSEAADLVQSVLTDLDEQFGQISSDFLQQGLVDVFPTPGKTGGAFCAHRLLSQPTYILLNHTDRLQDVLTMAHEFGHGINNELSRASQNSLNFGTSLATAEVASTFMEDFVLQRLRQKADAQEQLALLMMRLNDEVSTIFRQIACYDFEFELHQAYVEAGYLDQQQIGELFTNHMQAYMGPAVEQSSGSQNWWVYWSHIRNHFYVYSYASGLLISKSLQELVRQDKTNIDKVKTFLAAGISDKPSAIFAGAGLDIADPEFWTMGLQSIEADLDQAFSLAKELNLLNT